MKGAPTEAQVGEQRRAAFDAAAANHASHSQSLSSAELQFNKAFAPGRDFLRGTHRAVAAIARDEAVPWLAKWWNLARGVLADQPEILKLLGVVEGSLRKSASAKAADGPAVTEALAVG